MKLRSMASFAVMALFIFQVNTTNSHAETYKNEKYETYKLNNEKQIKLYNNEDLPPEVKLDLAGEANMSYLQKKTDLKYEVAMAKSNGEYTYVKAFDNLDEAIKEVNKIENKSKSTSTDVPVIINEDGIVTYATQAIGRLTRLVDGVASSNKSYNVNIYPTSTSKNAITYVNHGYMDDMPIIDQTDTRVKVEVNGVTGWIDKEERQVVDGKEQVITHVVEVPLNQANNLSYYKKSGNDLVHYISSDITGTKGYSSVVGKAPSFMSDNVKYYSYDGNYFYNNIEKLLVDAENGNHNNAINSKNIYYNYYQYLPGRTKASYTADDINRYFEENTPSNSILRNTGLEFIQAQEKYGVNASYMIAIAMNESAKGTSSIALNKNNLFGINAVDLSPGQSADYFKTVGDCIDRFASHWMSKGYFNPSDWRYGGSSLGNKGFGVNVRYASDPYWGEKASSYMYSMDKYLSDSGLSEYNKYNLGIYNSKANVTNSNGSILYTSTSGYVVPILSTTGSNYKINLDRQVSSTPDNGNYSWSNEGIVSQGSVTKINSKYSGALNQKQINVINKFEQLYIYGTFTKPTLDLSKSTEIIKTSSQASNILRKTVDGVKYDRQKYLDAWNSLSSAEKEHQKMQSIKKEYTKTMSITEAAQATLKFYENVKSNSEKIINNSTLAIKLNSKTNMTLGARGAAYKEYNEATKHGENSKNSDRMNYMNQKYVDTVNFLEVIELMSEYKTSEAKTEASKIVDSTLKSEAMRAIDIYSANKYTKNQKNVISKFKQFYIYGPMDNPIIDLSNKEELITKSSDATNILKKVVDGKKYDRQKYLDAWNALTSSEKSLDDMQTIKKEYLKIVSISEAAEGCLAFYEKVSKNAETLINNSSEAAKLNDKENKSLGARGKAHKEYNEATKHGENSKNSNRMNYINQKYLDSVNFLDCVIYLNNNDIENVKIKVEKIKDSNLKNIISEKIS